MKYLILTFIAVMATACAPKHVGIWVNETGKDDTALVINQDNTAQYINKEGKHQLYTWATSDAAETPGSAYFVFKGFKTERSTDFTLDNVVFYTSAIDGRLYLEGSDIYISSQSVPSFKKPEPAAKPVSKAPKKK